MESVEITFPENGLLSGRIQIGGSKSISNRFLILQFLSGQEIKAKNLSDSLDTQTLRNNLEIVRKHIGTGEKIYCKDGGAPFRFLLPLLAITPGDWVLDGSERLRNRPHQGLADALKNLGADIASIFRDNKPPYRIRGKSLQGRKLIMEAGVSSQWISALMMVAPKIKNGLTIEMKDEIVSGSYIHLTAQMMKEFGLPVLWNREEKTLHIPEGNYSFTGSEFFIESDWASASYWYGLLCAAKGGNIHLSSFHPDSIQGDAMVRNIYETLGVESSFQDKELFITRKEKNCPPDIFQYLFTDCPDVAPTVAISCVILKIPFRLDGLSTLNQKESERIRFLSEIFYRMGITAHQTNNSLEIRQYPALWHCPPRFPSGNDHRMAMAFSAFSSVFRIIQIAHPEVVNKSYPFFWNHLKNAGFKVRYLSE